MGNNASAAICFGLLFDDGFEFPWDVEPFDGIERWWRHVNGYQPPFEIYDATGNYLDGVKPSQDKIDAYHDHRHDWMAAHPIPIERVNVYSGDDAQWILAIPSTIKGAEWADPLNFDPRELVISEARIQPLREFCAVHGIKFDADKLGWWLSAYWG